MKHIFHLLPALLLLQVTAAGQTADYELYKQSPDSCAPSVTLYRDGTFFAEGGCGRVAERSVGQWQQVQDTVFFLPQPPEKIKVVRSLTAFFTPGDTLNVTIIASCGKNISNSAQMYWKWPDGGLDPMLLSPQGMAQIINPPAEGYLLLSMMDQYIEVPGGFANNFIMRLNIPAQWASAHEWCRMDRFYLLKKDGRLVTPDALAAVYEQQAHQ
ncbi:hypothetical protein [Chitinophaga sp. YIM B06452]|uniref:hypothetical protein n=1 Tax=Chitinophaga sp. YIM B06452 TaxID=3082158 RepID=UPI0031FF303D